MRADWVDAESLGHVLAALTPLNRLACEVAMRTGMRIGDVLRITTDQARRGRWSYHEAKTGKVRRVRLTQELQRRALALGGDTYVFEGRCDGTRCRTRQAVYKDIVRAAKAFRLCEHISPHSLRKVYAVRRLAETGGDMDVVRRDLNHESISVTMIYALADALTARKMAAGS